MVDYRALATTPVTTAELRRGKLATEKTMQAYRSSAAAANTMTVKREAGGALGGVTWPEMMRREHASSPKQRRRRGEDNERERERARGEMALST